MAHDDRRRPATRTLERGRSGHLRLRDQPTGGPGAARWSPRSSTRCCSCRRWGSGSATLVDEQQLRRARGPLLPVVPRTRPAGRDRHADGRGRVDLAGHGRDQVAQGLPRHARHADHAARHRRRPPRLGGGARCSSPARSSSGSSPCSASCESPWAILAVPAAVLTGLAFAAPITAFAATQENDSAFASLMRFGILPMFLFSGTFFPIDQLPAGLEAVGHGHAAVARRRAVPRPLPRRRRRGQLARPRRLPAGVGGGRHHRRPLDLHPPAGRLMAAVDTPVESVADQPRSSLPGPGAAVGLPRGPAVHAPDRAQPARLPPHLAGDPLRVLRAGLLPAVDRRRASASSSATSRGRAVDRSTTRRSWRRRCWPPRR